MPEHVLHLPEGCRNDSVPEVHPCPPTSISPPYCRGSTGPQTVREPGTTGGTVSACESFACSWRAVGHVTAKYLKEDLVSTPGCTIRTLFLERRRTSRPFSLSGSQVPYSIFKQERRLNPNILQDARHRPHDMERVPTGQGGAHLPYCTGQREDPRVGPKRQADKQPNRKASKDG